MSTMTAWEVDAATGVLSVERSENNHMVGVSVELVLQLAVLDASVRIIGTALVPGALKVY